MISLPNLVHSHDYHQQIDEMYNLAHYNVKLLETWYISSLQVITSRLHF